jgi:hypothetical protein
VLWTAGATGCATPEFRFFVWNGTSWSIGQEWSSSTTFSWNTTGLAARDYLVEAWARAGTSGTLQANSPDVTYTLTASAPPPAPMPCTAVSLSPSPASPQQVGTTVLWTAGATGCATPEFKFLRQAPGSSTWEMVRDWGASEYSWNTIGLAPGTWSLRGQARRTGSSATYEAEAQTTYTLTAVPTVCSSVSVSANPASPRPAGTTVAWTASSVCSSPQFQFYLLPPGGSWALVRDWGSADYSWNTTSLSSGTWTLEVRARQVGSSATYESVVTQTYDLAAGDSTPPSVTVTTTSLTPTSGSSVTFTGSATDNTAVTLVEFAITRDTGTTVTGWTACTPADGAFNESTEAFTCVVTWPTETTAQAGNSFNVLVRAGDAAGNKGVPADPTTGANSANQTCTFNTQQSGGVIPTGNCVFQRDNKAPFISTAVKTTDAGLLGKVGAGDTITLTFPEEVRTASTTMPQSVTLTDGTDTVTLTNGVNATFSRTANSGTSTWTIQPSVDTAVDYPAAITAINNFRDWADNLALLIGDTTID